MKVGSLVYFDECGESLGYGVVVQMDSSRYSKGVKVHWFGRACALNGDSWFPADWLTEVMT
jgi:hypothetical protein